MSRFREPFSGFSHLAAAIVAAGALVYLIAATWHDPAKLTSMIVYGVSLILLFTASTMMHLIKAPERIARWLTRFDHAAIYVLIAGTYTPFCYNLLAGGWRWGMLGTIWGLAVAGLAFKLFLPWKDSHLSTVLYVVMGWIGIIIIPQMIKILPPLGWELVVGGGLVYSFGAIFFALDKPESRPWFSFHDVWHLFVIAGSALHFIAIAMFLV
jgi:hemolysin III